jgi:molecular chaperone DnaK (HSP70)
VDIKVLQGERDFASDNKALGNFKLEGIPPAPRGIPQIEVKFDIDANGIVSVSATDKATGKEQNIVITGSGTLSDSEIEKMVSDAEKFREEDAHKKELIETKNGLETLTYQSEKLLNENSDKISDAEKEKLNNIIADSKNLENLDDLKESLNNLTACMQEIATSMYQRSSENQADEEEVVDVKFEDDE